MSNSLTHVFLIARRDFRALFTSPIAYIVIGLFLAIMGWMFYGTTVYFSQQAFQFQQYGKTPSLADAIIRPVYGNMNVFLLFLFPFITMRLFAEERKQHTLELLITAPLNLSEIVFGKFLSTLLFLVVLLSLTLIYPIILLAIGNPEGGPIIASYVGTFLLAASILSLGVLFSSMTDNQFIAGVLTIFIGLFFWIINWATAFAGPVWSDFFTYLSLITHYNNFSQGTIDSSDVVYYLSFIGFCLFLTHRVLDSYRWR